MLAGDWPVQVGSPLTITRGVTQSAAAIRGCVQQLPWTKRVQEFLLTRGEIKLLEKKVNDYLLF